MLLSKRTEYGLRAVVQLARQPRGIYVQSKDLAQQEGMPTKFLEAILLTLRRGEFLESKVGSGGGYRLARSPNQIVVGDLIRRLEDRMDEKPPRPRHEPAAGEVAVRIINEKLVEATDDALAGMTLEQLLEQIARLSSTQQSMYYI